MDVTMECEKDHMGACLSIDDSKGKCTDVSCAPFGVVVVSGHLALVTSRHPEHRGHHAVRRRADLQSSRKFEPF